MQISIDFTKDGVADSVTIPVDDAGTPASVADKLATELAAKGTSATAKGVVVTFTGSISTDSNGDTTVDKFVFEAFDKTSYKGYDISFTKKSDGKAQTEDKNGRTYATSTITVAPNAYKLEAKATVNFVATSTTLNGQSITIKRGNYSANSLAEEIAATIEALNLTDIEVSANGRVVTIVDKGMNTAGDKIGLEKATGTNKPNWGFDVQ